MISFQEIKASEKILNEIKVDLDSFTSYERTSHTDNFILVDKNGKVYKSCLTRNPEGCPDPFLFYGCLFQALSLLERIIWKDPETNLQEGLLFNLCAIYELESSHSMQKKQKLLELVAKHRGDGFNTSFLKIA